MRVERISTLLTLNGALIKKDVIVKRLTDSAFVIYFYELKEYLDPEMTITSHMASELTSE